MTILHKIIIFCRTRFVINLLWLVVATSFIWFPYIGMISIPCRKIPSSVSPRFAPEEVDYESISEYNYILLKFMTVINFQ